MSTTADQPHAETTALPRAAYQPHAIKYYDKVINPLYSFDATICSAMCASQASWKYVGQAVITGLVTWLPAAVAPGSHDGLWLL